MPPEDPPPRPSFTPDYQPPKPGAGRGAAIVLWIIAIMVGIPAVLSLTIAFALAASSGSYGAIAILAAGVAGVVALVVTVARKATSPANVAAGVVLCMLALGMLAFGVCATHAPGF